MRITHYFSVEKREASLKKMLGTVLKDKEKIEQTIEELDRYKRDALKTTWEKVNGYARAAQSPSELHQLTCTQGLWRHLRRAAPRELFQAAATRRARPDGRARDQSTAGERMEAKPNRAERWTALADRALVDHGTAAVQASADVHTGRDRRCARSFAYTAYWHALSHAFSWRAVYRRLAQGGPLHER